jgi:hypothetical protein
MKSVHQTTNYLEDVRISVKVKLSGLWVALTIFYIYADIISLYKPGQIEDMTSGLMGPFPATQLSLLMASVLMAIPAAMIFLSLVLNPKVNRWTNIFVGALHTVIGIANVIGVTWIYYIFYGGLEIIFTLIIIYYAWTWPKQDSKDLLE